MPTRRKINSVRVVFVVVVCILIIAGLASVFVVKKGLSSTGNGDKNVVFTIESGQTVDTVAEDLEKEGLISNAKVVELYAKMSHNTNFVAGTFELNNGMSVKNILAYIQDSTKLKRDTIVLKVPEGKWAKEIAAEISSIYDGKYSAEEILNQWNDISYIQKIAKDYSFINVDDLNNSNYKVKLEGYLFPDTYYLEKDDSIDDITRILLDRFDVMYKENKEAFEKSGYSVQQVMSLASVVQFEASSKKDMETIAGVFYNRLEKGMKLQSSVTVCYALYDDFNDPQDCETNAEVESPYNTYLNEGLPIGPILNPGEEAIKAVLSPKHTDYLFFAADIYNKVDGKVHYSKTYEEHLQICKELGLNL